MAAAIAKLHAVADCAVRWSLRARLCLCLLISLGAARPALSASEPASVSFAPPSAAGGPTMFTRLAPEATGVKTENHYDDPRMWAQRYQEFLFGAVGTGVAIGDYDGDGRPDIFAVSKTESCRLFRNLGGFRFEDVTDRAGVGDKGAAAGIWKQGATFADVNNDGRLDLYVCRFDAANLLYINQGDGTFREQARDYRLDVADASGMAAFCDFDRDGWLDVYIATNLLNMMRSPNGQRGHLLRNRADGTFADVTEVAGIFGTSQSHSGTWWDYDNDGWPDLYVANDYAESDRLYHNNRDGTFSNTLDFVVPHTSFASMGADFGDVNNDGLIDFLSADMATTTHEKDQRSMADTRGRAVDPADFSAEAPQYPRSALYLNTGTGRCLEAGILAGIEATDWTWGPRFEDLDNDGWLDLFVPNGMFVEQSIDINTRMLSAETTAERVRIMRESPVLNEKNLAFRNRGDLRFENVGEAWGLGHKGISFGAAFGDLDGDGDLDLVFANYQDSVAVLRNDSDTGHRVVFELRGTISNRFGVGAVVQIETAAGRQVRQLWLARGYMSSSEPVVHFGLGEEREIARVTVTWPSGRVQTFTALPADRRYTITEPEGPAPQRVAAVAGFGDPGPGSTSPATSTRLFAETSGLWGLALMVREEPVDEVSLQRLLPARFNRRGPGLAVGDVNADGIEDVVVGGTTQTAAQVLLGSASGNYAATDTSAVLPVDAVNDGPVLLFDAMGNGVPALLVTKGGNSLPAGAAEYQPRLYVQDGAARFQFAADALPELSISASAAVAADFDRDGRLDVFIGARLLPGEYPQTPKSALLRNRGGQFEDATDAVAPGLREVGLVTSALWTDVDQDGWPDLLVALEWGPVRCFRNERGRGFSDWTERAGFAAGGSGWWTSLAAADFNGDGQIDYAAGNVGLNTQYRASATHPALLFLGSFRGEDYEPQVVEAYYEGDRLYPWRSRRDLGAAIPSVLKRYPRNNAYARATLGEILGEEQLAAAERFAATELRSGVFLSQPDGTFRFEPLPRIAQIAPLQGMVAGDFDGDGHADLYAVQNSYAPIAVVGRFDGGLSQLLCGDGQGHFTPVPPGESGLIVPGDAKAVAVLDLGQDGWPDFLVTRNNRSTQLFEHQRVAGRQSLRVQLRGPAGNPTAVGAKLTAHYDDGSTQAVEIQAGAGYYSQSLAAAFFGSSRANPVARVVVRWPTGQTTEHAVPAGLATLTFAAP